MTAFVGVDIGTSGLKVTVVGATGSVLARASASYPSSYPRADWAEQDPQAWVDALRDALRSIEPTIRRQVIAIAAVGHVPTAVLVDDHGHPLRPAITWQDSRARHEANELEDQLGAVEGDLGTELPWSPSQLIPKLAWVSAHEPALRDRTRWVLQPKDFVNHYLTSAAATDPWSSKGICDVRDGSAATRLLAAAGWTDDICPQTHAPWEPLGTVTPQVAVELGLNPSTIVATGWSDALAAVLAVGAFDSPHGFILTGTSNIVGVTRDSPAAVQGLYSVPAGPTAPLPLVFGPTQSGGEALAWGARLLGLDMAEFVELAASAAPGDAPTFVPYLRGERAPLWDPAVRALFAGVGSQHGRAEFARAIINGVAFSARHVLELATAGDTPVDVGGVGVEDRKWAAMWASALRRPLRIHPEANLSAMGAAMLAAWATGCSKSDLTRLRPEPAEFAADVSVLADNGYEQYLRASLAAQEWSNHG